MRTRPVSARLLAVLLVVAPIAACKSQAPVATTKDADSNAATDGETELETALDQQMEQEPDIDGDPNAFGIMTDGSTLNLTGHNAKKPALSLNDEDDADLSPAEFSDVVDMLTDGTSGDGTTGGTSPGDDSLRLLESDTDGSVMDAAVVAYLGSILPELREKLRALEADAEKSGDTTTGGTTTDARTSTGGTGDGLRLAAGTNDLQNATDLQNARDELKRSRASIARLEALIKRYETGNKLYVAQRNQPDQFNCTTHGAVRRGDKCQCRGWGADVVGFSFDVPTTSAARARLSNIPRRCPVLERMYCVGDFTKSGQCGLFGKQAGYSTPAIAPPQSRIAGEKPGECWLTIDKIIRDNRTKVFGASACGKDIAIQRGKLIEMWEYNTTTGEYLKQLSGAGQPNVAGGGTAGSGGKDSRLNNGGGPNSTTGSGTADALVATTVEGFQRICDNTRSNAGIRAVWTAAGAGGGGCECKGRMVSADVYLKAYSQSDRQGFPAECREALNAGTAGNGSGSMPFAIRVEYRDAGGGTCIFTRCTPVSATEAKQLICNGVTILGPSCDDHVVRDVSCSEVKIGDTRTATLKRRLNVSQNQLAQKLCPQ